MSNIEINKQARLSQHFTLGELCKTSVKTADGNIQFDELLIERNSQGTYWLHFAVRPKDNRMKIRLMEK